MKRLLLALLLLGAGAVGVVIYSFLRDTYRGGAPNTILEVYLPPETRQVVLTRMKSFALDNHFHLTVASSGGLWMETWKSHIWVRTVAKREGDDPDPARMEVWVNDYGWLWYSSLRDIDNIADAFADDIRRVRGVRVTSERHRF